ncbi:MAG: retroviral-like aspartic protease family protein [Chloroflexota bacterium]|nr:retroviral-like aspartic protease family protein [Chloroflexota bacterium]
MGVFSCQIRVASLDGARYADFDATVDTGATHTFLPSGDLRALGVRPLYTDLFEFADGRRAEMDVGLAMVTIGDLTQRAQVVFAEGNVTPLLGADTLQGMKLAVDMANHRIVPVERL